MENSCSQIEYQILSIRENSYLISNLKSRLAHITILLFFTLNVHTIQAQNLFIFSDLDHAVLELWVDTDQSNKGLAPLIPAINSNWAKTKTQISAKNIPHFDKEGFIVDQDQRIQLIQKFVTQGKIGNAKNNAYAFLKEFLTIRALFTTDDYPLDAIIESHDAYTTIHDIVHDDMMGLYEWTEFLWFIDELKCRVTAMEEKLSIQRNENQDIDLAITKLNQCLVSLDESLGDAYGPDFELRCNDLGIAFLDLFSAYIKGSSSRSFD